MKVSELMRLLTAIQAKFGDIAVTGGDLQDETPLYSVTVTDTEGMEVWPNDPNGVAGKNPIDGVFFTS